MCVSVSSAPHFSPHPPLSMLLFLVEACIFMLGLMKPEIEAENHQIKTSFKRFLCNLRNSYLRWEEQGFPVSSISLCLHITLAQLGKIAITKGNKRWGDFFPCHLHIYYWGGGGGFGLHSVLNFAQFFWLCVQGSLPKGNHIWYRELNPSQLEQDKCPTLWATSLAPHLGICGIIWWAYNLISHIPGLDYRILQAMCSPWAGYLYCNNNNK